MVVLPAVRHCCHCCHQGVAIWGPPGRPDLSYSASILVSVDSSPPPRCQADSAALGAHRASVTNRPDRSALPPGRVSGIRRCLHNTEQVGGNLTSKCVLLVLLLCRVYRDPFVSEVLGTEAAPGRDAFTSTQDCLTACDQDARCVTGGGVQAQPGGPRVLAAQNPSSRLSHRSLDLLPANCHTVLLI